MVISGEQKSAPQGRVAQTEIILKLPQGLGCGARLDQSVRPGLEERVP